jgi:hypothetical protein
MEVHLIGEFDHRTGIRLKIERTVFPGAIEDGGDLVTTDASDLPHSMLTYLAVEFDDLARRLRTMAREKV